MLYWQDVSHSFGPHLIIDQLSLEIATGDAVSLVGPSGCGKSTLLSMASGLLEATEGDVCNGFSTTATVFQEDRTLPWMTCLDNIAFGLKAKGVGQQQRRQQARALAHRLRLADSDLDKYPHELSGGMRQRVALGRALALQPDLLLLDEPFSALDIGLKRELQDLVLEQMQRQQLTAIFITHDLLEAVRVSDRIVVMAPDPGRIVYQHQLRTPIDQRDDHFIYQEVANLLDIAQVRQAFELDNPTHDR